MPGSAPVALVPNMIGPPGFTPESPFTALVPSMIGPPGFTPELPYIVVTFVPAPPPDDRQPRRSQPDELPMLCAPSPAPDVSGVFVFEDVEVLVLESAPGFCACRCEPWPRECVPAPVLKSPKSAVRSSPRNDAPARWWLAEESSSRCSSNSHVILAEDVRR